MKAWTTAIFFILVFSAEIYPQWVQTNVPGGGFVGNLAVSGDNVFAGTEHGLFLSVDSGATWTAVASGLPANAAPTSSVAIRSDVFVGFMEEGLFHSSDQGKTWTAMGTALPSTHVIALAASSDTAGLMRIAASTEQDSSRKGQVFVSTSLGNEWTEVYTDSCWLHPSVLALSGNTLFLGKGWGGGLLRVSWSETDRRVDTLLKWMSVTSLAMSEDTLFVGTGDGLYLFGCNDTTRIYRGRPPGVEGYVSAVGMNRATIFVSLGFEGIYRSADHGTTWTPMNSGLPSDVYVEQFAFTKNNIFAGTMCDGVWRHPLSEMTTAADPGRCSSPDRYFLYQNYPNPFNPLTIIKYSIGTVGGLGQGSVPTRLVVYDLLGREVKMLVNEQKAPGAYEVRFDGSRLSSGVYIYRVTAGQFAETKKMVLAK